MNPSVGSVLSFIAIWDPNYGVKMVETFPASDIDFDTLVFQIFTTYQNFYKMEGVDKTSFKLNMSNVNKICTLSIDKLQNDILKIVALLFPDFFPEDQLKIFDNIIQNISAESLKTKSKILEKYYDRISDLYNIEQMVKDSEIIINENYTNTNALQDFKLGLEEYQKNELDHAYFLLRKAHLKFELDNQLNFILQTSFFLPTILMQKNKFGAARTYLQKLKGLAEQLQHKKYFEKALFMECFCDYQGGDYKSAYTNLKLLEKTDLEFVSKPQYFLLLGKILADAGNYAEAKKSFEKSLELFALEKESPETLKKKGEIYLDLGHISHEMVYKLIKSGKSDKNAIHANLTESTKYYAETIKIWKVLDNYVGLIQVYQLIANNYEILNDREKVKESYEKALEVAELKNDIVARFKLLEKIIQIYTESKSYEELVKKIDVILFEIAPIAFFDLATVAHFHTMLGQAFAKLDNSSDALSEYVVALNIYNKFENKPRDLLNLYQDIIDIYEKRNDADHIQYYKEKQMQLQSEFDEKAKQEKMKYLPLTVVEEFWVFNKEGAMIFSYTPKTGTNSQLISGFLVAMDNFSSELKVERIKSIKIGVNNYSYYKEPKSTIFIVGRSDVKFPLDVVEKFVHAIHTKFWELYKPIIETFDGDKSKFEPFIKYISTMELN